MRCVGWTLTPWIDLKIGFNFRNGFCVCRPTNEDRACHFFPREVCFYKAAFTCGLRLPVHLFIMKLLGFFGIAPGQLMPNSWRIVVNCMEIWLAANKDMIKVGELIHLYRLNSSISTIWRSRKSMDIMSWSLGQGELGLWRVYLRPSGTRSPVSFLCLGTTLRPPPARLGVISQGCSVGGEPQT